MRTIQIKSIQGLQTLIALIVALQLFSCSNKGANQLLGTIPKETAFVGYINGEQILEKGNFEEIFKNKMTEDGEELRLMGDLLKAIKAKDIIYFGSKNEFCLTFYIKKFGQFQEACRGLTFGSEQEVDGFWMATSSQEEDLHLVSNKKQAWLISQRGNVGPIEIVKKYLALQPEASAQSIAHIEDIYSQDAGIYFNYGHFIETVTENADLLKNRLAKENNYGMADEEIDWSEWEEDLEDMKEFDHIALDTVQETENPLSDLALLNQIFPMLQEGISIISTLSFEAKEINIKTNLYTKEGKAYVNPYLEENKITEEALSHVSQDAMLVAVSYVGQKAIKAFSPYFDLADIPASVKESAESLFALLNGEVILSIQGPNSLLGLADSNGLEYMVLSKSSNAKKQSEYLDQLMNQISDNKSQMQNGIYHQSTDLFGKEGGCFYGTAESNYLFFGSRPFKKPTENILKNKVAASLVGSYGGFYLDLSSSSTLSMLLKSITEYNLNGYILMRATSPSSHTFTFRNESAVGDNILEGFVRLFAQF